MKKNTCSLSASALIFFFIFCQATPAFSQLKNIGNFIRAGEQDAETLTKAYLKPLPSGFGADLNSGWFSSADTHRPLGFDIQIRGAGAFIPSQDQSFNFNDLDLSRMELADGESPISPTAGGDDTPGPKVIVKDKDGNEVGNFKLPQGSGFHIVPSPMVQASVGLIKHTDVIVRFMPKVKIGDYGDFNMKGVGIKHSLSQWLPGGKFLPVDISIMAGFNRIELNANLNVDPEEPDPTTDYDNQKVETSFNTFTMKLLVGKDLPFLSVYGGVGYETSTMHLAVKGNYPVQVETAGVKHTESITDPFSYSADGKNKLSLTGGLKLKLFFFHIFGEYTQAEYPIANAGIGFSFR